MYSSRRRGSDLRFWAAGTAWLVFLGRKSVAGELAPPPLYTSQIDTIFAFGDSYSATGYDPDQGVNNIPGIGKTTSGGYNWLQFLASTDLTQPVALYDFAVTGAVINNSVIYNSSTQPTTPTDFVQQVATWKKYFAIPGGSAIKSAEVTWKPNRALFTVWFGINDVGLETLLLEDPVDKIPRIFGTLSVLINDLYTNGARNFLFLTVPPTERTPTLRSLSTINITDYTSTLALFNEALSSFAATIPLAYPTTHVTTFDTQDIFNDILDAAASHGFSDSTSSCSSYSSISTNPNAFLPQCGWPLAEYVWYDGSHPTWRVHEILAGKVAQSMAPPAVTTEPSTTASSQMPLKSSVPVSGAVESRPRPGWKDVLLALAAAGLIISTCGPFLCRPALVVDFGVVGARYRMVIYLQVARILQALIFITRSHSFFFMERPSVALFLAFCLAQLISSIIAAYGDWGFSDVQGVSSSVSAQLPVVPAINALYDTIFSFGDSYTTNGYDPSKGITNIPDVGGTSSGGSSWPTFLANAAPPVKIELYNFAVGGAATNNTALYLAGQPHTIPDFPQQFDTFKQYFAQPGGIATSNGTVTWQSNRTLFTVFFGINDVGLEVRNGEDRRIELPQIFGTWSNIFSQLYTLGARNFLILSIPPTQRTPFISGLPPDVRALYESDLSAQNEALSNFVGTIESAYSGSKVTFFDTQPVFADILDNYQSYGFKDNSTYCDIYASISTQPALFLPQCGIPLAQYVWWNSGHPSWPVHQILASKIAEALLDDGVASSTGNTTNATSSTEVSIVNSSSATSTTSSSSFGWFANIITSLFPGLASGS